MDMLKKCLNPKVLLGLLIIALVVLVVAPKILFAVLPFLLIAACPLSMVLMMGAMHNEKNHSSSNGQEAFDLLKQRYAKGEINQSEFEQMKRTLSHN